MPLTGHYITFRKGQRKRKTALFGTRAWWPPPDSWRSGHAASRALDGRQSLGQPSAVQRVDLLRFRCQVCTKVQHGKPSLSLSFQYQHAYSELAGRAQASSGKSPLLLAPGASTSWPAHIFWSCLAAESWALMTDPEGTSWYSMCTCMCILRV